MSDSDASAVSAEIYSDIIWLLETYTSASSSCLHISSVYVATDTDGFFRGPLYLEGIWVMSFIQTLPMEVEVVWNSKITLPTILFLLNRYGFSLGMIINMAPSFPGTETDVECNMSNVLGTILTIGPLLCTNLFFTLRVYATSNHSKSVLFVSLALILARLVVDSWQAALSVGASTARDPGIHLAACEDDITVANPALVSWCESYVASGGLALTFDGFIFAVTVVKLFGHLMEMRKMTNKGGITALLLRDGIIYFIIMFLVAATQAGLALVSAVNPEADILSNIMDPYFQAVPNILVNHLYLNLRRVNRPLPDSMAVPAQPPQNRFLGHIGEPLDHDQWDSQFDSEDFPVDDSGVDEDTIRDNAATTLVPVIYDNRGAVSNADIEMVPIERDSPGAGPSRTSGLTA
ncbi:uncharacterized protein STEHIDRAFT_154893 [Stereum hirsutum FP-91666 SS1]|uniref:uncharacterized protein n=1 Tax=Stereum hirsutum (strain FP-91666) TaxID=721885 RepID=UPI000440B897|nr:uncharacterized protein STEHIDRAFT_154893 [Stereum hirsutum FP-91666 SS1]EIM89215.1 hypothetical protein STEHIDRAFT_154893 [Stereum hirsutum FP-91666 SS1]